MRWMRERRPLGRLIESWIRRQRPRWTIAEYPLNTSTRRPDIDRGEQDGYSKEVNRCLAQFPQSDIHHPQSRGKHQHETIQTMMTVEMK